MSSRSSVRRQEGAEETHTTTRGTTLRDNAEGTCVFSRPSVRRQEGAQAQEGGTWTMDHT